MFAAETDCVDEVDDSVELALGDCLGGGGGGGGGGWTKNDVVDFFDGVQHRFGGFGCGGGCVDDWFEFFFGFENVVDCQTPAIVFHSLGVDVDECQDILDGPAFAVLVFGHEVGDFDS